MTNSTKGDTTGHHAPLGSGAAAFLAGWRRDIFVAIGFFTRLPVGRLADPPRQPGFSLDPSPNAAAPIGSGFAASTTPQFQLAQAARAFPVVGLIVGVVGGLIYLFAIRIGLTLPLAALLAVAATAAVTGALHEDGWADFADGLGARGDKTRKLAAMKDSHIGSFGVLALLFATAIKVSALIALGAPDRVMAALIVAHVLARSVLPLAMRSLPLASSSGLGAMAGKPKVESVYWSLGLGLVLAFFAVFLPAAIVAFIAALVAAVVIGKVAERQFGGYTGDVLGAMEQVAEVAVLINLVSLS